MNFLFDDTCKVVNKAKDRYDVYIGRGSPFGNPVVISGSCTREDAIRLYREYFYERIRNDSDFKRMVQRLKGKVLGCHCKPKACHGDIIKEYLERNV